MKRIIFVRALKGYPDSRLEKELYSLSKKYNVTVLGWNREKTIKEIQEVTVNVFNKEIKFSHICLLAPIGRGFAKLWLPELKFWFKVYCFLKKHKHEYDIIHACDFDTGLVSYIAAKKFNKKIVYDIFDYYSESHSAPKIIKSIIKKMEDYIITNSNATIICSEQRLEQIKDATPKQVVVIHNTPIETNEIFKQFNIKSTECSSKRLKIVYVGVLSEDRFLREMASVIGNRKDYEWHVAGWGILESYIEEISKKYNNIFFYGKITYEDAIALEKQCDIMTAIYDPKLPNHKYAAPNKFYEALMLKKPLIMIKDTGMDSYISKFAIGEVINLNNHNFENGLNIALNNLIEYRDEWDKISKKDNKIYKDYFSWEEMEKRLLILYDNLS